MAKARAAHGPEESTEQRAASGGALQLEIDSHAGRDAVERLRDQEDPLPGEPGVEPRSSVEPRERRIPRRRHHAGSVCRPLQPVIMENHQSPIPRHLDVQFHHPGA